VKEEGAEDEESGVEELELDDAGEVVVATASTWTWALAASASESPIPLVTILQNVIQRQDHDVKYS
jgi:hypothetical protein